MAQALALSAAGDSVVPPVAPPSPIKPEPQPEPEPEPIARFSWNEVVREWVSAPPVWMGATPAEEAAYLEMWRQRQLAEERRRGEYEEMLERDLEEEAREAEEEAHQAAAAQPPAPALPPPEQLPAAYIAAAWNTTFPWAVPPPTLIDLTHPKDDDDAWGAPGCMLPCS